MARRVPTTARYGPGQAYCQVAHLLFAERILEGWLQLQPRIRAALTKALADLDLVFCGGASRESTRGRKIGIARRNAISPLSAPEFTGLTLY